MALKISIAALAVFAAAPLSATHPEHGGPAPQGGPNAEYCLRVEAVTGSRLETVLCLTRQQWAALEIDVDAEWAKGEGVAVKG